MFNPDIHENTKIKCHCTASLVPKWGSISERPQGVVFLDAGLASPQTPARAQQPGKQGLGALPPGADLHTMTPGSDFLWVNVQTE